MLSAACPPPQADASTPQCQTSTIAFCSFSLRNRYPHPTNSQNLARAKSHHIQLHGAGELSDTETHIDGHLSTCELPHASKRVQPARPPPRPGLASPSALICRVPGTMYKTVLLPSPLSPPPSA